MVRNQGFTLIEVSIVIVVIGLIFGGVLLGRDLITAAQVRSTISQIEEYNTAIQTFRLKYNCLPGDCLYAVESGIGVAGGAGDNGGGDGHLGRNGGAMSDPTEYQENFNFWTHLSNAGLTSPTETPYLPTMNMYPPYSVFPKVALGNSEVAPCWECFRRTPADELDNRHLFVVARIGNNVSGMYQANNLTPAEVFSVDAKVDDGIPDTGSVVAMYESFEVFSVVPFEAVVSNCIDVGTTPYTYVLSNTSLACSMAMRMNF